MKPRRQNKGSERSEASRRRFLGVAAAAAVGAALRLRRGPQTVEAKERTPKDIQIVEFSDSGERQGKVTVQTIVKSDAEWKQALAPDAYQVTRHSGTERPYSGKYLDLHDKGLYHCICCGTVNFSSETKFDSGTGWPSFWQPIAKENVREVLDASLGQIRRAVSCPRCEAHLGHVFDDGPRPTGLRYCMNSVALDFKKSG